LASLNELEARVVIKSIRDFLLAFQLLTGIRVKSALGADESCKKKTKKLTLQSTVLEFFSYFRSDKRQRRPFS
jgi:hypothetical protein